jgi:hypothetical protein
MLTPLATRRTSPTRRVARWTLEVGLAVTIGACSSYHMPGALAGDIPLVVANQTAAGICSFRLAPADSANPGDDWIGLFKPQAGSSKTFQVKPGSYRVTIVGCHDDFRGDARFSIAGPTNLMITPVNARPANLELVPPQNYARVLVPVTMSQTFLHPGPKEISGQPFVPGGGETVCSSQGQGCALDADCCTGLHCMKDDPNQSQSGTSCR